MVSNNTKMRSLFLLLMACSLIAATATVLFSQQTKLPAMATEASTAALQKYVSEVVNKENFSKFNFKSYEEVATARLGQPYPVMYIGLQALQRYTPGTDIKSIAQDTNKIWFPVEVRGEARTKMVLVKKEGAWIAGEFGGTRTVEAIADVRSKIPRLVESRGIREPYTLALLEIPALYANFFYIESQQGNYLVPAMIRPGRYQIENGYIYPANELLARLKDFAVKIDGTKLM
jgi:hypothetical protein